MTLDTSWRWSKAASHSSTATKTKVRPVADVHLYSDSLPNLETLLSPGKKINLDANHLGDERKFVRMTTG